MHKKTPEGYTEKAITSLLVMVERWFLRRPVLAYNDWRVIREICLDWETSPVLAAPRRRTSTRVRAQGRLPVKPWTRRQDARAKALFAKGVASREVATQVRRSAGAVRQRAALKKWARGPKA